MAEHAFTANAKVVEGQVVDVTVNGAQTPLRVVANGCSTDDERKADATWAAWVLHKHAAANDTWEQIKHNEASARAQAALTLNDVFTSLMPGIAGALNRRDLIDAMIDPRRRVDRECGYPEAPDAFLFRLLYERDAVVHRVIRCFPEECWKSDPEVCENQDGDEETEFEEALAELIEKFNLWYNLHRADELSGIGRYGVLLLGTGDGDDYSVPLEGINERGERVDNKGEAEKKFDEDERTWVDNPAFNPEDCPKHDLFFLKPFDETCLRINMRETTTDNPRFGQAISYTLLFMDTDINMGGAGLASQVQVTRRVHWTRVIHLADNRQMSEIFGLPRAQPVLNSALDARKTRAGAGEGYWRGAVPTIALELQPGVSVSDVDKEKMRAETSKMGNSLDRILMLGGATLKPVFPQAEDPTPHVNVHMEAISIALGIPKRILYGSERGELASSQDAKAWNDRLKGRQSKYISTMIIRPLIDRCIMLGILPTPEQYSVDWPDLQNSTDAERALVAKDETAAISQYASSGGDQVVSRQSFLSRVLRWDQEAIEQNDDELDEQKDEEEDLDAAGMPLVPGAVPGQVAGRVTPLPGQPGAKVAPQVPARGKPKPGSGAEPKPPETEKEREAP